MHNRRTAAKMAPTGALAVPLAWDLRLGSLITPGGIATGADPRAVDAPGVAHHPWRDRNLRSSGSPGSRARRSSPLEGSQRHAGAFRVRRSGRRSSPLEGSQHHPAGPAAVTAPRRSSPLEGSQRGGGRFGGPKRGGRSSPLEGSQPPVPAAGPHHPGVACRSSPLEGSQRHERRPHAGVAGSLITPGGIATAAVPPRRRSLPRRSSPLEGSQPESAWVSGSRARRS